MTKLMSIIAVVAGTLIAPGAARAHCQMPCGIFNDEARVQLLQEHVVTIGKAVKLINELARKQDAESKQQLVRWVDTKEHHAQEIMEMISGYFMAQRIKPAAANNKKAYAAYLQQLATHHAVMLAAMKCKQSVDPARVKDLAKAVDSIAHYWHK